MNERAHCPYLGLRQNRAIRFAAPTAEHRCYVNGEAQEIPVDQRTHCLSINHLSCPLYTGEWSATTAGALANSGALALPQGGVRSRWSRREMVVYLAVLGLLATLTVIWVSIGLLYTNSDPDNGNTPLIVDTATATATPTTTVTASTTIRPTRTTRPTRTPRPTHTATASATATAEPTIAPTQTERVVLITTTPPPFVPPPPPPPTQTERVIIITAEPTVQPTAAPTAEPTAQPTAEPTAQPTPFITETPVATDAPPAAPEPAPTSEASTPIPTIGLPLEPEPSSAP